MQQRYFKGPFFFLSALMFLNTLFSFKSGQILSYLFIQSGQIWLQMSS